MTPFQWNVIRNLADELADGDGVWSYSQQLTLAVVPKVASLLSLFGSCWIVAEVAMSPQKREKVYHRLLFGMSLCDIMESTWNFMSTWPIPAGTANVVGARGTTATCTAQGFFLQLGLAVPIYNASLSIYYLMVIRYGISETVLRTRAEPIMHAISISLATGTAVAALCLDLFNNANLWCWIAPLPADCLDSKRHNDASTCERGDNAFIYRWAFYFAPLWFCVVLSMVTTVLIYLTVRKQESVTATYRQPELTGRYAEAAVQNQVGLWKRWKMRMNNMFGLHPLSSDVMSQAFWYVGAFYLSHLFSTINRVVQQVSGTTIFPMLVLHSFLDPLQGFLNFWVYRRPRYVKYRREKQDSRRAALAKAIQFSFMNARREKKAASQLAAQRDEEAGSDHSSYELAQKQSTLTLRNGGIDETTANGDRSTMSSDEELNEGGSEETQSADVRQLSLSTNHTSGPHGSPNKSVGEQVHSEVNETALQSEEVKSNAQGDNLVAVH